jgi:hypothetical protein
VRRFRSACRAGAAAGGRLPGASRQHCGQAFEGRIVANTPEQPNDPFAGQTLVMHVRECGDGELKVPFHVGDDHSRTWVLTRTATGLRLKHDHRHEDGTDDAVTMYGGDTAAPGTEVRQEFPVDQESIDMFQREGLTASLENTWAMEIEPGQSLPVRTLTPDWTPVPGGVRPDDAGGHAAGAVGARRTSDIR